MPSGIPLTFENMLPEISEAHCRIYLPGLSENINVDKRFLKHRLGQFYDLCVRARLRAPGNEKQDQVWTKEGTGLDVLPMDTKRKSKRKQVADYQLEYSINGGEWINSGLAIERKRFEDFYNSVLFKYDNFMDEFEAFEQDPELFDFRIIVEGRVSQVLNNIPVIPTICKCCRFCEAYHNNKKGIHRYCCTFDVLAGKAEEPKKVDPTGKCDFCIPYAKTEKELGDIRNRLMAIIEDFENMGYHISFYDSREMAMGFVPDIAKRYFVANYARLLGL